VAYGQRRCLVLRSRVSRYISCHPSYLIVVISLDVKSPEGLANHAETLSDYLYEYGGYPSLRGDYSVRFFEYLLSACWPKLHRRFCSWQGLGFIRTLEERVDLLKEHIDMIGTSAGPHESFSDRGPGDRTLVHLLYANRDNVFESMVPSVLPLEICQPLPSLNNLREAIVNAVEKGEWRDLYTGKTALDFHYLVYAIFLLAGQAIRKIKDHSKPLKQTGATNKASYDSLVKEFKKQILAAVLPMKLLQYVLSSTIFKKHVHVWTNDGAYLSELLPKWSQKRNNMRFGKKRGILATSKDGPSEEGPNDGGGDMPEESPTSGLGGENVDISKEGCEDDGDEDHAPEVCKPIY